MPTRLPGNRMVPALVFAYSNPTDEPILIISFESSSGLFPMHQIIKKQFRFCVLEDFF